MVLNTFSESPIEIQGTLAAEEFSKLTEAIADTKRLLALKAKTARLWILYLDYVVIIKKYIFAERTSNSELTCTAQLKC